MGGGGQKIIWWRRHCEIMLYKQIFALYQARKLIQLIKGKLAFRYKKCQ
jgi:transposase